MLWPSVQLLPCQSNSPRKLVLDTQNSSHRLQIKPKKASVAVSTPITATADQFGIHKLISNKVLAPSSPRPAAPCPTPSEVFLPHV